MNENNQRFPVSDEITDQQRERIAKEQNIKSLFGIESFPIRPNMEFELTEVKGSMFIRKDNRQKRRKIKKK